VAPPAPPIYGEDLWKKVSGIGVYSDSVWVMSHGDAKDIADADSFIGGAGPNAAARKKRLVGCLHKVVNLLGGDPKIPYGLLEGGASLHDIYIASLKGVRSTLKLSPDDLEEFPAPDDMKGERWDWYYGQRETSVLLLGYSGNDLVVKNLERPHTGSKKVVGVTPPQRPPGRQDLPRDHPEDLCLGHLVYGRVVVQLGLSPEDWGYVGACAETWARTQQRVALAFQACGAIVVDGHHVWRHMTKMDPYHVAIAPGSAILMAEWCANLVRLAFLLRPTPEWVQKQQLWLDYQVPILLKSHKDFLDHAVTTATEAEA
jgi:hypothetical protein